MFLSSLVVLLVSEWLLDIGLMLHNLERLNGLSLDVRWHLLPLGFA
jgi:hypothetical protein